MAPIALAFGLLIAASAVWYGGRALRGGSSPRLSRFLSDHTRLVGGLLLGLVGLLVVFGVVGVVAGLWAP